MRAGIGVAQGPSGVAIAYGKTYPLLMDNLILAFMVFGLFGLFWLGFARLVSSKDEWKKEKSNNIQMIGFGIGLILLAFIVVAL